MLYLSASVGISSLRGTISNAFSALTLLVGWQECKKTVKTESWGAGMVICQGQGADLHMAQLCHSHSLSLALVNPDWFYLSGTGSPGQSQTKGHLNGCLSVCQRGTMSSI